MDAPRSDPVPRTKTILLVEDHAAVRALAQRVLASCGYAVLAAGDGAEALRLASGPIDLLVTDVVLPDVSGRMLAEWVGPGVRVLFISGHPRDVLGGPPERVHFLQKPFSPADLARKVREVLDAPVA